RGLKHRATLLAVWQLQETVGEADFVENLQDGRVDGVAAEVAVEVLVHFQERDGDTATCEQQREHGTTRSASDNGTGAVLNVATAFVGHLTKSCLWLRSDQAVRAGSTSRVGAGKSVFRTARVYGHGGNASVAGAGRLLKLTAEALVLGLRVTEASLKDLA